VNQDGEIGNWCLLDSFGSCSFVFGYSTGANSIGFYGHDVSNFFSDAVGTCSNVGQLVAAVGNTIRDIESVDAEWEQSFCFIATGYEGACGYNPQY